MRNTNSDCTLTNSGSTPCCAFICTGATTALAAAYQTKPIVAAQTLTVPIRQVAALLHFHLPCTGATVALAAAYQTKPIVAAQTLEWVLRGCIRVETPNGLSNRSCGPGPPGGSCSSELNPAIPVPYLARAFAAAAGAAPAAAAGGSAVLFRSTAESAGRAGPGTAPVGSGSLSECLKDDLGCLVLLCHRVVLGVAAVGPYQQTTSGSSGAAAGGSSGSSGVPEAATKHLVAVLNSCLKLLNRLAVPAGEVNPKLHQFTHFHVVFLIMLYSSLFEFCLCKV